MTARLQSRRADRIGSRWAEIDRLRNRRDSEAILRLLSLLDDPLWDVRERALNVLWESAVLPHARLAARALLQDPSPCVRSTAAEALGEIGRASDASRLVTALCDPEWMVRASVAGSLGRFRTAKAQKSLAAALA